MAQSRESQYDVCQAYARVCACVCVCTFVRVWCCI